jgi:hypothetical protein
MENFFGYILLAILLLLIAPLVVGASINIKLNSKYKSIADIWYLGFYAVSIWVVVGIVAYCIPQIIFNNI